MSDSDLLTKGDLIKSRWRITHKIGGGGFGQIYQAYDKLRRELVAVKVESNSQARQGIRMEVTVLRRILNRQHVCELFSGGTSTLYNYMIMTLLGSSLSELRRQLSDQCFTLSTSLRVSLQILKAIESVHSTGFLHRDIKPSNFAIGRLNSRQIFILDFGLARKYTDYDQHVRPARTEAGFRGTIRYASINAHNNRELGRHDDLWSFFYMLIEFLVGSLPWSKIKDKENVGHMKESYDYTRFLTYLPDEFEKFLEHIHQLQYEDTPDYEFLRSLFISANERLGYQDNDLYDWEKSIDQDESDSLGKIEQPPNDDQRVIPESSIHIKRNTSRSPTPNPTERISNVHGVNFEKSHLQSKHFQNNRQVISRTSFSKQRTDSNHNLPLQRTPYDFHRIKLDSNSPRQYGTGDQQQQQQQFIPETRSPDTLTRRSTHLNIIDRGQATSNGLLTFISQQFSNAAAPGTPSLFSQWSPHNGETLTDDDILKGNKSNSSRADERATTLSGEPANPQLNHPNSSTKNNSAGRTPPPPFIPPINRQKKSPNISDDENPLPPKQQQQQQSVDVPFGTYGKTSRRNNSCSRRQATSPRYSIKKYDYS